MSTIKNAKNIEDLTPSTLTVYMETAGKYILAQGSVGETIFSRTKPVPSIREPKEDQPLTIGKRTIPNQFQYGTRKLDLVTNIPLFESDGITVALDFSKDQCDQFRKDLKEYNQEIEKINKVKSIVSTFLNFSISPESEGKMKGLGIDRYSNALKDPVEMLLLMDESHKKSSDSNLLSSMNTMLNLRQVNFTSFPMFFADFMSKSKEFTSLLLAASSTKEEVVGHLLKCIMLNNINQEYFKYTIFGVQSSKKPMSLSDLSELLTVFYNNNTTIGEPDKVSALTASLSPPSPSTSKPKKIIKSKCEKCNKEFAKTIDKRTSKPFKICKPCATENWKENQVKLLETKTSEPGASKKQTGSKASNAMNGALAVSSDESCDE
jgi:hypothetical protein